MECDLCDIPGATDTGVICFRCLDSAFEGLLPGDRVDTTVVCGKCVARKADCGSIGCRLNLCPMCVLSTIFPSMISGDFLITNVDGSEPTMSTDAELAIDGMLLRLKQKGIDKNQRNQMKPQMIAELKSDGGVVRNDVQVVRVQ
jgi:hypothetical protein